MTYTRFMGSVYLTGLVVGMIALGAGLGGIWGAIGAGSLGLGLILLGVGLRGDPSRGRKRCPKCWYDMSGSPTLVCPECGRDAGSDTNLGLRRRFWRIALAGAVIVLSGLLAMQRLTWQSLPVLSLAIAARLDSEGAWNELVSRTLAPWAVVDARTKALALEASFSVIHRAHDGGIHSAAPGLIITQWGLRDPRTIQAIQSCRSNDRAGILCHLVSGAVDSPDAAAIAIQIAGDTSANPWARLYMFDSLGRHAECRQNEDVRRLILLLANDSNADIATSAKTMIREESAIRASP